MGSEGGYCNAQDMTLLSDPPIWAQLVLTILAVWRLTVLLAMEGGPFGIFRWFRGLMGIGHDDGGEPISWPEHPPGSLFACTWCLSFWTTLLVYGILVVAPGVVTALGTWGAVTYLEVLRSRR